MTIAPRVSVVIPVLDAGPMLLECVASVGKVAEVELILVDNGSSDGAADTARAAFPEIRIIRNDENRGFAVASNQGLAIARGRYVLFLNADAVILNEGLEELLQTADKDPSAAIWQPIIIEPGGGIENAGEFFTTSGFFIRRREEPSDPRPYAAFAGTAACMLGRREVLQQEGGFAGGFFAYIEDVDLCWRLRLRGWEVRIVPTVSAQHMKSTTTMRLFQEHEIKYLTFRNRFRMILANASVLMLLRMVPLFLLGCLSAAAALALSGRGRSALAVLRALIWPVQHLADVREQRRRARPSGIVDDGGLLHDEIKARIVSRAGLRLFRDQYGRWKPRDTTGKG